MLEVRGVHKRYGAKKVLDNVSFTVSPGRLTGFVGGNGAGKTTTMRIILGVLSADSGSITIDDAPLEASSRRRFGYMPEERGLYPKMKLGEQLIYLARLHGLNTKAATRNTHELLEKLSLTERINDPLEKLSLGNQQRAQISAALVHEPDVLILDEPFSGLDPMAVDVVIGVLAERASKGVPVLFSSHQLDLVERLCDDLVIIADGIIRAAGERESLREERTGLRYHVQSSADTSWLAGQPGVSIVEQDQNTALIDMADEASVQEVIRALLERGEIKDFARARPTLAQIFREIIQ